MARCTWGKHVVNMDCYSGWSSDSSTKTSKPERPKLSESEQDQLEIARHFADSKKDKKCVNCASIYFDDLGCGLWTKRIDNPTEHVCKMWIHHITKKKDFEE